MPKQLKSFTLLDSLTVNVPNSSGKKFIAFMGTTTDTSNNDGNRSV